MTRCDYRACAKPARSRGLCNAHYKQARKNGTVRQYPLVNMALEIPVPDRFWAKVRVTDSCWEWTGRVNEQGYGTFRGGSHMVYVHRWSWERQRAPIPAGLTVDHLCRNRRCVRIDHLEIVTNSENALRSWDGRRGMCVRGHDLAIHGYVRPDTGARFCRICANDLRRARRAAA
jgi:hypothetical protein